MPPAPILIPADCSGSRFDLTAAGRGAGSWWQRTSAGTLSVSGRQSGRSAWR